MFLAHCRPQLQPGRGRAPRDQIPQAQPQGAPRGCPRVCDRQGACACGGRGRRASPHPDSPWHCFPSGWVNFPCRQRLVSSQGGRWALEAPAGPAPLRRVPTSGMPRPPVALDTRQGRFQRALKNCAAPNVEADQQPCPPARPTPRRDSVGGGTRELRKTLPRHGPRGLATLSLVPFPPRLNSAPRKSACGTPKRHQPALPGRTRGRGRPRTPPAFSDQRSPRAQLSWTEPPRHLTDMETEAWTRTPAPGHTQGGCQSPSDRTQTGPGSW